MKAVPSIWMIHGPTASGKTSLAVELAKALGCEILSCDARQVYREMRIGVARPSEAELAEVRHHGIASHSIHEPLTAASYAAWAEPILRGILAQCGSAVVVGGSGLYAKALLEGLDPMPPALPEFRSELEAIWLKNPEELRARLRSLDPEYAAVADLQNPRRVLRALEVIESSGQAYSAQRRGQVGRVWPVAVREVVLEADSQWLDPRIMERSMHMMAEGLRHEADGLKAFASLTPLQTVGYREFYEPKSCALDDQAMTAQIALRTRQYSKRQRTWLAKIEGGLRIPAEGAWNYLRNHAGA